MDGRDPGCSWDCDAFTSTSFSLGADAGLSSGVGEAAPYKA